MRKHFTILFFLFLSLTFCYGQSNPRYLVLFKDKANSPYEIGKPEVYLSQKAILRRTRQQIRITENDLPVNPAYITAVKQTGALAIFPSRWFNGLVVEASNAQLEAIKKLSFFKGIELNLPLANISTKTPGVERTANTSSKFGALEDVDYGRMRDQLALLGVDQLHKRSILGQNMIIAILDDGFSKADTRDYYKHLFDDKRIVDTYNFLSRKSDVYAVGEHGQGVLSTIAAYKPGTMVGAAYKASFALYSTENTLAESPYEEVTWLLAAERADSLGADVINSSLGYYDFDGEFDTPSYNYTYEMMDGKTTIISRAARIASRKGIIVVNAAGNEGNKAWKYIVAPADVDSVLTVGATDYLRNYASLSSVGPNAAKQLKPDVAAVGTGAIVAGTTGNPASGSGTSYASPQIAGLAAILWQAHPGLTSQQIIDVLKRSGHQASKPDMFLGYGVPDVNRAEEIITKEHPVLGTEPDPLQNLTLSPNPGQEYVNVSFPSALIGRKARMTVMFPGGNILSAQTVLVKDQIPLDIKNLSPGLYLLQINIQEKTRTMKFLKM